MDINHRSDTAVVSWRATHGVAALHRKSGYPLNFPKADLFTESFTKNL